MDTTNDLYKLIYESQKRDEKSLEILCQKFDPLIKKYSYYLNYEDSYDDLLEVFILIIKKIPIQQDNFKNNKYILSYIMTSIKNAYIFFSKEKQKYLNHFFLTKDNSVFEEYSYLTNSISEEKSNIFMIDMKKILSKKEYNLLTLKFIKGYSDEEIGKILGITRQAINKQLNRLKRRIKELYY